LVGEISHDANVACPLQFSKNCTYELNAPGNLALALLFWHSTIISKFYTKHR